MLESGQADKLRLDYNRMVFDVFNRYNYNSRPTLKKNVNKCKKYFNQLNNSLNDSNSLIETKQKSMFSFMNKIDTFRTRQNMRILRKHSQSLGSAATATCNKLFDHLGCALKLKKLHNKNIVGTHKMRKQMRKCESVNSTKRFNNRPIAATTQTQVISGNVTGLTVMESNASQHQKRLQFYVNEIETKSAEEVDEDELFTYSYVEQYTAKNNDKKETHKKSHTLNVIVHRLPGI